VDRPVLFSRPGRFVKETLTYTVAATCDAGLIPVITVSSNQPEKPERRPDIDWVVLDPTHVLLRAENERFTRVNGKLIIRADRIYTITATVTDSAGSRTSSSVEVKVARHDHDDHDDDGHKHDDDRR
jgi:hypothetical protein